jgi:hypothetical protein
MKDRIQKRIERDTRGISPEALVSYFRDASRRFWREMGRPYPEFVRTPMSVHETNEPKT